MLVYRGFEQSKSVEGIRQTYDYKINKFKFVVINFNFIKKNQQQLLLALYEREKICELRESFI